MFTASKDMACCPLRGSRSRKSGYGDSGWLASQAPQICSGECPLPGDRWPFLWLTEQRGKFWERLKETHSAWRAFEQLTAD